MEEQQVDEELVAVDLETDLPADEGETWPQFGKCV